MVEEFSVLTVRGPSKGVKPGSDLAISAAPRDLFAPANRLSSAMKSGFVVQHADQGHVRSNSPCGKP